MMWVLLLVHVNQVMLGIEQCVQTLMNVVMVLTFVILVMQCVPMQWALTCSCKSGYARNGTLCTDTDRCADAKVM